MQQKRRNRWITLVKVATKKTSTIMVGIIRVHFQFAMIKNRTANSSLTIAHITQISRVIAVRTLCKLSMANRHATSIWLVNNKIFSRCKLHHRKIFQEQITTVCILLKSRTTSKFFKLLFWIRKSSRTSESSKITQLLSRNPLKKPFSMCKTAWIISK